MNRHAHPRLAVWLDSYRRDLKSALSAAAGDGFALIRPNAVSGEMRPSELSVSGRKHLARHLRDLGLRIDALAAPFPGRGLADAATAERRVEDFRQVLSLCSDLNIRRAAVTLAGISDPSRGGLAQEMLRVSAELADRHDVQLLIHSGEDAPQDMAEALRRNGSTQLRLGVDSLSLRPDDLSDERDWFALIGDAYLRDGRRRVDGVEECEFGKGDVDFRTLLGRLSAGGFGESLVIRRNSTIDVDALRAGRDHIRSILDGFSPG